MQKKNPGVTKMLLMIDIPKRIYDHILRTNMLVNSDRLEVTEAIISGIPRPKSNVNYISTGDSDGHPVYDEAECPSCGKLFEEDTENWECNFCPDCGEQLDWTFYTE